MKQTKKFYLGLLLRHALVLMSGFTVLFYTGRAFVAIVERLFCRSVNERQQR